MTLGMSLPEEWQWQPAVSLAKVLTSTVDKLSREDEAPVRLCNYTDVYYNDVLSDDRDYMVATASPAQLRNFHVEVGDVVFTKDSESADDIGIAAYIVSTAPDLVYGYHLSIYRARDARYRKFLKWVLDSAYVKNVFKARTPGVTRVGLSQNTMKYLRIATPPPDFAQAISDYLDRETAEIDAFIADQEKLIELLTERRAATINRVARKPQASETPKTESLEIFREDDWESRRLKTLASIRYGLGEPPPYVDDGVPLIRATNVRSGSITSVGLVFVRPEDIPARRILWLHEGDLVVVRSGATTGDAALVEGEFAGSIAGFDMVVRPVTSVEPRFLKYVLLSADVRRGQIELLRARAAQPHLNAEELGDLEIAIPSLSEQRRIADELDLQTSTIDSTIADAREAIALSKERRTALISAAVTGKIDVGEPGKVNA